jgi:hypothetical protein
MMKRLGLITLALLFAIAATAGITRISSGSATPTNCVAGNLFIKTSATVGLYYCSTPGSPGTWTQVGAGSGTVSTTGSPANGNLAKFSGSATVTNTDLTGDVTTSGGVATTLATSGVSASTYGDATHASQITVDAKGRITSASSVAITGVPAPSAAGYMRSGVGSPSGTGYVQSTTGAGTSLAFTSNVTSGNLLVVACGGESTVDPLTISDTRSTTWTKATAITTGSNHLAVYYGAATSSGADTVTCGQANSLPRVGLMEISGVNATVDATATVYYNSTSPATLNITTSTAGSFIFGGRRSVSQCVDVFCGNRRDADRAIRWCGRERRRLHVHGSVGHVLHGNQHHFRRGRRPIHPRRVHAVIGQHGRIGRRLLHRHRHQDILGTARQRSVSARGRAPVTTVCLWPREATRRTRQRTTGACS